MNLKSNLLIAFAAAGLSASSQGLVTDLPAVYITTSPGTVINTEEYVNTSMTIIDVDGTRSDYADTRLRGRGSAKFALPKKPYKIKLFAKEKLLGSEGAKAKKWNLMARHGDKTLLRNSVGSFIALEAGQPFAPGTRFVDLTIDGEYQGTYQLTDQIDIRKNRVNITEQPEVVTSATNITGGYLLEIDDEADELDGTVFTTDKGVKITVKSPDEDIILPAQTEYIKAHVQSFENSLFADNWLDPAEGYRKYIDLDSFVSWYITNEYAAEPNAFRAVYFYKDIDSDKLTFGPVWDFDFAFDNSSRFGSRPRALIAQEGRGPEWCYIWINRLRQDPQFHIAVNNAWKKLVDGGIVAKVNAYIDAQAAVIDRSQQKNFDLYPIAERVHDEMFLFQTYAEGVEFLKKTQAARADFLTEAFATLAAGGTVESSIEEVVASSSDLTAETVIYDLQGRRVANPRKGLFIKNGKVVKL